MTNYYRSRRSELSFIGSREEEMELVMAMRSGDLRARDRLIRAHIGLAIKRARSHMAMLRTSDQLEDLVAAAMIGVIEGVDHYDPERLSAEGKPFRVSTCCVHWIDNRLKEFTAQARTVVRTPMCGDFRKAMAVYRHWTRIGRGDRAMLDRMFAHARVRPDHAFQAGRLAAGDSSLDVRVGERGDSTAAELLPDHRPGPEEIASDADARAKASRAIHRLLDDVDPRAREIFLRRWLVDEDDKPTLLDLSREYGVSRERIRQIEERTLAKVAKRARARPEVFLSALA
jgi:RNA polymerase sigma-32 factor